MIMLINIFMSKLVLGLGPILIKPSFLGGIEPCLDSPNPSWELFITSEKNKSIKTIYISFPLTYMNRNKKK